jgi:hypothetical protein
MSHSVLSASPAVTARLKRGVTLEESVLLEVRMALPLSRVEGGWDAGMLMSPVLVWQGRHGGIPLVKKTHPLAQHS